jgi:hypothetical protein
MILSSRFQQYFTGCKRLGRAAFQYALDLAVWKPAAAFGSTFCVWHNGAVFRHQNKVKIFLTLQA